MNLPYSIIFALYLVALLAVDVHAATAPSLRSCLNSVTGLEVVTSSDSKFKTAKEAFDLRFTYTPEAVVVGDKIETYHLLMDI
jgi:hypothetical protein